MGLYDDIRSELTTAATQHHRAIALLNAAASAFRTELALRLETDESNIMLGQGTGDVFEAITQFPANGGRNEIFVSVLVSIALPRSETFTFATTVKFRTDRNGLCITVEDHGERNCGDLTGIKSNSEWQQLIGDFVAALQSDVKRLIDNMKS
jgi:hypothetical protein